MAAVLHSVPTTSAVVVTLEEDDVQGAVLEDPLDSKTIPQLWWWLLCHGVEAPSSVKTTQF